MNNGANNRTSDTEVMTGTQPIDQSKHSHHGLTKIHKFMEYK